MRHFHGHPFVVLDRKDEFERIGDKGLQLHVLPKELGGVGVLGAANHPIGIGTQPAKVGTVEAHLHHLPVLPAAFPHQAEAVGTAARAHQDRIHGLHAVALDIALGHHGDAHGTGIILGKIGEHPHQKSQNKGQDQDNPFPAQSPFGKVKAIQ